MRTEYTSFETIKTGDMIVRLHHGNPRLLGRVKSVEPIEDCIALILTDDMRLLGQPHSPIMRQKDCVSVRIDSEGKSVDILNGEGRGDSKAFDNVQQAMEYAVAEAEKHGYCITLWDGLK